MNLTKEQNSVISGIIKDVKNEPIITCGGFAGTGKAQPNSCSVYTEHGPQKIGDIKPGDIIANPEGSFTKVNEIFPQGEKQTYEITLEDGSKTRCTEDHLWCINNSKKDYKSNNGIYNQSKNYKIVNTKELIDLLDQDKDIYIPLTKPFDFKYDVIVNPYLMGLLLNCTYFNVDLDGFYLKADCDKFILDKFKEFKIYFDIDLKIHSQCLQNILFEFKLNSNQYSIPDEFKFTSIKNRKQLIYGLIDSRGVKCRNNQYIYQTKNSFLANDIAFIIRSLGGLAKVNIIKGNYIDKKYGNLIQSDIAYEVLINIKNKIYKYKKNKCKSRIKNKKLFNKIKYIEKYGMEECTCIKVENENSLYVTDDFIVTHNTTILKKLAELLPKYEVCGFTGKCANVLRKKGVQSAKTIHSLIYTPVRVDDKIEFELKTPENLDCNGFLVDEASMISKEIYEDMLSFKKPIIFIGDHGQLEPIGSSINIMKDPKYKLEEIHRNAGEIAHFANHIRKGNSASSFAASSKIEFLNINNISMDILKGVDQAICAFNKFRIKKNEEIRFALGHKNLLEVNDRIICLKNNKRLFLFNGMQGVVTKVNLNRSKMNFISDDINYYEIRFNQNQFGKEKNDFEFGEDDNIPFDYSYVVTCHKMQGDEAENVLVFEQYCDKWDHKRWAYTAASRAREKIFWAHYRRYVPVSTKQENDRYVPDYLKI